MASQYPNSLDTLATNKNDSTLTVGDHAQHHDDLADAVNKIEAELGINPSGSTADIITRLAVSQNADGTLKANVVQAAAGLGGPVGITLAAPFDARLSLYNATGANMLAWRKAFARQKNAAGRAHILCVGDSITQGFFATNPYYTSSFTDRLRTLIEAWTGVATGTGVISSADLALTTPQDGRITQSGLTSDPTKGYAGSSYEITGAGQFMQFAGITADEALMVYLNEPGSGVLQLLQDGAQVFNGSTNAAEAVRFNGAAVSGGIGSGPHTFKLAFSGGTAFLLGFEGSIGNRNTGIKVSRLGVSGRRFTDVKNAQSLLHINGLVPDLVPITLGVNDMNTQTTIATFKADGTAMIQGIQASGATVLIVVPPQPLLTGTITWLQYQQALYDLATTLGCPLLDMTERWQGHDTSFFQDTFHPNNLGHIDFARALYDVIVAVS